MPGVSVGVSAVTFMTLMPVRGELATSVYRGS